MMKKIGGIAALVITVSLLTGCGVDEETQACIDQVTQTLEDAGSDRALTQAEEDACANPEQRAFILGE